MVAGAPVIGEAPADPEEASRRLSQLLQTGMSRKDAIRQTAQELGLPKNVVYEIALKNAE